MVQIGSGFKKTKEIHIRKQKQQGSTDRSTNNNPSAVVGPNGSRIGSNRENELQASTLSKIAGKFKPFVNPIIQCKGRITFFGPATEKMWFYGNKIR